MQADSELQRGMSRIFAPVVPFTQVTEVVTRAETQDHFTKKDLINCTLADWRYFTAKVLQTEEFD